MLTDVPRRPSRRLWREKNAQRDLVLALALALVVVVAMATGLIVLARTTLG